MTKKYTYQIGQVIEGKFYPSSTDKDDDTFLDDVIFIIKTFAIAIFSVSMTLALILSPEANFFSGLIYGVYCYCCYKWFIKL